ncbi:hypothetical protein ACPOL_6608 [Acidisarcina polymorpha]|uniref:Uncharacterized protein n=1 Tax=Acidisarcina polymorpha TaxID=2211140 RepID=A0A2Z5GA77_9BACT|nr:hypothetical protein ACPOL_6608 [Acidisarcina polymorpha]
MRTASPDFECIYSANALLSLQKRITATPEMMYLVAYFHQGKPRPGG